MQKVYKRENIKRPSREFLLLLPPAAAAAIGSITSRCSAKWAHTQRPYPGDGGNRAYCCYFPFKISLVAASLPVAVANLFPCLNSLKKLLLLQSTPDV